jgi:hypothetical protein
MREWEKSTAGLPWLKLDAVAEPWTKEQFEDLRATSA